jgi:DNA polymerase-1
MHIPIIEVNGYEADDLIGNTQKPKRKLQSLWSPDKDFAQLVSENIFMYKPVWVMASKYGESWSV